MRILPVILVLSAVLLAGGCATYRAYPGPKRPHDEVAVLTVPPTVTSVDGEPMLKDSVGTIELLPGRHAIEWEFIYPNSFRETQRLTFEAKAGERYRLGQRFFPPPHPAGPIGEVFDFVIGTALIPLEIVFPSEPPTEAPDGAYYRWIIHHRSERVIAGLAPDVPQGDCVITFVPPPDQ